MFSEYNEKVRYSGSESHVLILVLVEYVLRAYMAVVLKETGDGLNPCFSGICSQSPRFKFRKCNLSRVLILVLVEYVLRVMKKSELLVAKASLNPCFSGICSQR